MTNALLKKLNNDYLSIHAAKEDAFWSNLMGLRNASNDDFLAKEARFRKFISDSKIIPVIEKELAEKNLNAEDRLGLEGWLRFFSVNSVKNDEAIEIRKKTLSLETALQQKRRNLKLGYHDPKTGKFIEASLNKLTLIQRSEPDEDLRKAAWTGIYEIENFVLQNGYLEIVRERNRFAKLLGFVDYYDYKVNLMEGCSKKDIFRALDELEEVTREPAKRSLQSLREEKGASAGQPWNFAYSTYGDLTKQLDPYFPLSESLSRWMRSFSALGIRYAGARLTLDLLDRKGKFDNGFMHGPAPTYQEGDTFHPARINFTTTAVPGKVGSGRTTTAVLFHEAGHAAHFSNIRMPAPCYSQEHAPTSVAFAETQSMFLDHLILDAGWRTRYALDKDGNPPPLSLLQEAAAQSHRFSANTLRNMLVTPYFEKALYELSENELTPERVISLARETEKRMHFGNVGTRPVLSVPHILGDEASAYCHGYVLALMADYQTREYFFRRYGYLLDNPAVGPALTDRYWKLGNRKNFFAFVEDLTEEPFSAQATSRLIGKTTDDVRKQVEQEVANEKTIPRPTGPIKLDAEISIIHGDEEIAKSSNCRSLEELGERFSVWVRAMEDQ